MRANALLTLAVIGLLVGGLVGYLTRPEAAEIKLGPISVEVQGQGTAHGGGSLTGGQMQHVAIVAIIGGLVGAGIGFVTSRMKG